MLLVILFRIFLYLYFLISCIIQFSAGFSEELNPSELENYFLSYPSEEMDYEFKEGDTYYDKSDSKSSEDECKGRNRNY